MIGNKLGRKVNAALLDVDRVLILMDADGQPLDQKTKIVKQYLDARYLDRISIVLLDYEVGQRICYLMGIPIRREAFEYFEVLPELSEESPAKICRKARLQKIG